MPENTTDDAQSWLGSIKDAPLLIGLIAVMALMILPLPPVLLDVLLSLNISLAVVILLTSVYVSRPLDFSVFPALLLVSTLFRLGLNVASTRLILMGAAGGQADAGEIIETFGHFVVGGNSLVGIIVFLVLVIINFMVITKGAGRIAEVAARFTLDALPGKQMSIDAEHAAGALSDEEARTKRKEVEREADFYGAMDGASKFVRGDAIAGLIITAINIVGGLLIGATQGGLGLAEAMQTYTVLTVGDGLVSQIPALFISTATGVVVTRVASSTDLGGELGSQLLKDRRVLVAAAAVIFLLGLIPGMPFVIFAGVAGAIGYVAWQLPAMDAEPDEESAEHEDQEPTPEEELSTMLQLDTLSLEIGYGLVDLVDESKGGNLLGRLVNMRKQFAGELGIVVPPIHIRDNLELGSGEYRLKLKGTTIGSAELVTGRLMAINPGFVDQKVEGIDTVDPAFGLEACWIDPDHRHRAEANGYTVVDLETVVTTHVGEMVRAEAAELFNWQALEERLDDVRRTTAGLVDHLVPERISKGKVLAVLKGLLQEGVSIRDLGTILEALAAKASTDVPPHALIEAVRHRLSRQISAGCAGPDGTIRAALLDRDIEDRLRQCLVNQRGEPVLACDLTTAQTLFAAIEESLDAFAMADVEPVILAPPDLRAPLKKFLMQFFPKIAVICHREVAADAQVVSVAQLQLGTEAQQQPCVANAGAA
jgi:flagellar biosynthesis protein FlhA